MGKSYRPSGRNKQMDINGWVDKRAAGQIEKQIDSQANT